MVKKETLDFKVTIDKKGGTSITGQSDYMEKNRNTIDALANGTKVLIQAFPSGTTMSATIKVILPTGMRKN